VFWTRILIESRPGYRTSSSSRGPWVLPDEHRDSNLVSLVQFSSPSSWPFTVGACLEIYVETASINCLRVNLEWLILFIYEFLNSIDYVLCLMRHCLNLCFVKDVDVVLTNVNALSWQCLEKYWKIWKLSGSYVENLEYGGRDPSRWSRETLYPQKLAITSATSGGR
jgi:hypothetical protein